jgi:choline dehydrogenase-like flavoprotein
MATHEKVDAAIVGAGASGSVFAAVLAKAGKKVVVLEAGPDWQLSDLISSDFWGRRIKPASGPFLLEGKNPFGYVFQAGWGVGGAALHHFANFPRLLPNDYKIKSEHDRALDWPISYDDVAPYYDRVAHEIGMSGDAKAEEIWRPAGQPYPMPPMKTFRHGRDLAQGLRSGRHPHGAGGGGHELDRLQGTASVHLRRVVPRRLPHRGARQSGRHLSGRCPQGRRRSTAALNRHARA